MVNHYDQTTEVKMTGRWLNISLIEDFFYRLLKDKAFGRVVVGTKLSDTLAKNDESVTLVDCGNVRDRNAYGNSFVAITLYAKSVARGEKNVPMLAKMEDALYEAITTSNHEHYKLGRAEVYPTYNSDYDLHGNTVIINLTIV